MGLAPASFGKSVNPSPECPSQWEPSESQFHFPSHPLSLSAKARPFMLPLPHRPQGEPLYKQLASVTGRPAVSAQVESVQFHSPAPILRENRRKSDNCSASVSDDCW